MALDRHWEEVTGAPPRLKPHRPMELPGTNGHQDA
jgi:hypothetical protein